MSDDGFDIDRALTDQAARVFLTATRDMVANNPDPTGRPLRLTVQTADGDTFGHVDIDITSLWAMATYAARRSGIPASIRQTDPAPTGRPNLRLITTDEKRTS